MSDEPADAQVFHVGASDRDVIETRLAGMDKAIELIQRLADKVPSMTDIAIDQLKRLQDNKFDNIEKRFDLNEEQTKKNAQDVKSAVDAAFAAAKEAVGEQNKSNALSITKSEAAVTKQIDQLGDGVKAMGQTLTDKIDDVKDRLTTIEGHAKGGADIWTLIFAVGGFIWAIVATIAAVAEMMRHP